MLADSASTVDWRDCCDSRSAFSISPPPNREHLAPWRLELGASQFRLRHRSPGSESDCASGCFSIMTLGADT